MRLMVDQKNELKVDGKEIKYPLSTLPRGRMTKPLTRAQHLFFPEAGKTYQLGAQRCEGRKLPKKMRCTAESYQMKGTKVCKSGRCKSLRTVWDDWEVPPEAGEFQKKHIARQVRKI